MMIALPDKYVGGPFAEQLQPEDPRFPLLLKERLDGIQQNFEAISAQETPTADGGGADVTINASASTLGPAASATVLVTEPASNFFNFAFGLPQGIQGPQGPQGIQGSQGATGSWITMKGSVATLSNLPPTGNQQGDAYIVQADDSLRIWNGTIWVSGGSIQGPRGAQGPQGATGAHGPQGDTGATGSQRPARDAGREVVHRQRCTRHGDGSRGRLVHRLRQRPVLREDRRFDLDADPVYSITTTRGR
jgi:hypothetical protein